MHVWDGVFYWFVNLQVKLSCPARLYPVKNKNKPIRSTGTKGWGHSYRRAIFFFFFLIISTFFSINSSFFNLPYFPGFFFSPQTREIQRAWFFCFFLENFTNSGRTPPCIDTYLQLFPNFGKIWKKRSPIRMSPIYEGFPRVGWSIGLLPQ